MKSILTFCILLFVQLTIASSATINSAKLDSLMDLLEANNKFMGSVSLSKSGQAVYTRTIGIAHRENAKDVKATDDTKYRIGSISKMFTATMIFQLIEVGKITLNTKLETYHKNIPNSDLITISNLLNHRSGIYNFTNDTNHISWYSTNISQAEIIAKIAEYKPDFQPDEQADYSNSNYILLSNIIEQVTGNSYASELKSRICDKVNLKNTYINDKIDASIGDAQAFGFTGDWEYIDMPYTGLAYGAGGIVSTSQDLNKFIEALFAGKLINENSLKTMITMKEGYGMGIFKFPFGNRISFGHTGKITFFTSIVGYFKSDSLAVSIISNGNSFSNNDLVIALLNIYFDIPYNLPDFKVLELEIADLEPLFGVYTSEELPLELTISNKGNKLTCQATGQSAFTLESKSKTEFHFPVAEIIITFSPDENKLVLNQAGYEFNYKKKE